MTNSATYAVFRQDGNHFVDISNVMNAHFADFAFLKAKHKIVESSRVESSFYVFIVRENFQEFQKEKSVT